MLNYVSTYSVTIGHIIRVIKSCETPEQLENANNWAYRVVKNFFAKVLRDCKSGEVQGIEEVKEQSFVVIVEHINTKSKEFIKQRVGS